MTLAQVHGEVGNPAGERGIAAVRPGAGVDRAVVGQVRDRGPTGGDPEPKRAAALVGDLGSDDLEPLDIVATGLEAVMRYRP